MRIGLRTNWVILAGIALMLPIGLLLSSCSESSVGPARPADSAAPSAQPLRLDSVTPGEVQFSWRAPGDDSLSGVASGYDLRYSEAPINETNWDGATPALGVMSPEPPGSLERATISNLTPGLTYYFALKTRDEVPNWSPLSPNIMLTIPLEIDSPVPWNGSLISDEGTTMTSFIFNIYQKVTSHSENNEQFVVIDDIPYQMYNIPQSPILDALNTRWGFITRLDLGPHEYYFEMKTVDEKVTRLPTSGAWSIQPVTGVEVTALDYVDVAAGTFLMGNPNPMASQVERPQHEVTLSESFKMSRNEITNSQFCEVLNWAYQQGMITVDSDTVASLVDPPHKIISLAPHRASAPHGIIFSESVGFTPMPFNENRPVAYTSWFGAAFYCNALNIMEGIDPTYIYDSDLEVWTVPDSTGSPYFAKGWRLPTEAEWEYVAQYNDGRIYPAGNDIPTAGIQGNFGNILEHSSDVGQYPEGANMLGINDLAGNVWEWCHDWEGSYSTEPVVNPVGRVLIGAIARVVRGGSWGSDADELRCVQRFSQRPRYTRAGIGFRIVRTTTETQ